MKPKLTLRQLLEHADRNAVNIFNQTGELLPLYHIVDAYGTHTIIPPPPGVPKDIGVSLMRYLFEEMKAVMVVYMDEAWTITRKVDEDVHEQPRHAHDRQESIIYVAESTTEGELHGSRIIDTKSRELGPLEVFAPSMSEGRMVGLLPRHDNRIH